MNQTMTVDEFSKLLRTKGIRPSYQRVRVLEYLHQNMHHPTAEEIYSALSPEIPSLSRTTIYNTLHAFSGSGLVNCLNIDGGETRYDSKLENHGHFKCDQCGELTNFPLESAQLEFKGLEHFKVRQKNVIFNGLCPQCNNTNQITKGE